VERGLVVEAEDEGGFEHVVLRVRITEGRRGWKW